MEPFRTASAFLSRGNLQSRAGMVGSALFVAVFTLEGALRPGYDPATMYVSALSLGDRGWVQVSNFIITGLLLVVFASGAGRPFGSGRWSKAGSRVLAVVACCLLLSGPFVMDPAGTPPERATLHGLIHGILGGVVFSLMPVCCFAFLRASKGLAKWESLHRWTLIALLFIAGALLLFTGVTKAPPTPGGAFAEVGLVQRAVIIPFMAWVFALAWHMDRQERERPAEKSDIPTG